SQNNGTLWSNRRCTDRRPFRRPRTGHTPLHLSGAQKPAERPAFVVHLLKRCPQAVSKLPDGTTSLYSSTPSSIFRLALPFSEAGTMRSSATLPNRFSRSPGSIAFPDGPTISCHLSSSDA